MMYKKNFVAAIKVDGKVLRESSDRVELPFGSEYSILLKNLDSVRVQAKISIDGQEATGWLVIPPNSSEDIERFVKDLNRGNRFKFIERTEAIENHRGVKAEDGLIRIEFKREKVYEAPKVTEHHSYIHHTYYEHPWYRPCFPQPYRPHITWTSSGIGQGTQTTQSIQQTQNNVTLTGMRSGLGAQAAVSSCNMLRCANDAGITVPGSESQQKFVKVSGFETEPSQVITLHLVGRIGESSVIKPKTVDLRSTCQTCGKKSKTSSKFCSQCGTSLEIF